ncbi:hypothetical protein [Micromonospora sp. CPCC 205539]|uniref:hypothetical protein n=1 Tax=Micromonospora sp. CPCC 205539 TaxID=3122408 RepID=UPI003FA53FAB
MVLILESRSHLDLGDLPNLLAAELGVMTVRLERAIRSLDGVARVHVNRWGDGSAHLHMWFLARPYGRLQLRGTFLSLWDSILPPISEAQWRENLALVAAWLAEFGGRPLAEPPRIQWQAPSSLLAQSAAAHAAAAAEEEAVSVIEAAEEIPEPTTDSDLRAHSDTAPGAAADPADDDAVAADPANTSTAIEPAVEPRARSASGSSPEPDLTAVGHSASTAATADAPPTGADNGPGAETRPSAETSPGSDDRPAGGDRPVGGDRPGGDGRPGFAKRLAGDDRPGSDDRPAGGDRPAGADRPDGADTRPGDESRPDGPGRPGDDGPGGGTTTNDVRTTR